MTFWNNILQVKAAEVALKKTQTPIGQLEEQLKNASPIRPFRSSLTGSKIKLIAEIKQASPSKGVLCPNFQPPNLAQVYEAAGATAISVLTDQKFFRGSLTDLAQVKSVTKTLPVLRKDFLIDRYQLFEARVYGADAVLLIGAALTKPQLICYLKEAKALGMDALVEVHNSQELATALEAEAEIIGINNRDLRTFEVNLETTFQLITSIPKDKVVVAESGVRNHHDLKRLVQAGVNAALVGEAIVSAADPGTKIKELLGETDGSG
jgi:indole-3-glycerol phosphate synthase